MTNDRIFIYLGTYPDEGAARADYEVVKDLFVADDIGTYDAAVIAKDNAGKVHINKDEMATRHGAWNGAAVGAVGTRDRRSWIVWLAMSLELGAVITPQVS